MTAQLWRQSLASIRALVVLTVLLGVVYPAAVWVVGQTMPDRAGGQVVEQAGQDVGSRLIGQQFKGGQWFQSRPSAVEWDGLGSAPSNLGPSNPELLEAIAERRAEVARTDGVDPADVPPDALTTSGSGLDPHVSPEYARLQVQRVATERGVPTRRVRDLVEQHVQGRQLGFLGQPRVNVLELNLALARLG